MEEVILYFAPHQDDEVLSMGIGILESTKLDDTHVILCTDGSKSSVRGVLNNNKICPHHFGIHRYELSEEEFILARDKEFYESCKYLGVKYENIHIYKNRTIDGELSIEKSRDIINTYLANYPNAKVRTITPFGCDSQHSDHKNLGLAALELYREGKIENLEFFVEPYFSDEFKDLNKAINLEIKTAEDDNVLRAAMSYRVWNPKAGRFGVGYYSAKRYFKHFKKEKLAYIHKVEKNLELSC
jgi:LmbE family N-acetylglucosaminyl deacetylase